MWGRRGPPLTSGQWALAWMWLSPYSCADWLCSGNRNASQPTNPFACSGGQPVSQEGKVWGKGWNPPSTNSMHCPLATKIPIPGPWAISVYPWPQEWHVWGNLHRNIGYTVDLKQNRGGLSRVPSQGRRAWILVGPFCEVWVLVAAFSEPAVCWWAAVGTKQHNPKLEPSYAGWGAAEREKQESSRGRQCGVRMQNANSRATVLGFGPSVATY